MFFRDLLCKDGEKLDIKMNPDGSGQLHVPGLRVIEVKSFQHIKKVSHFCLLPYISKFDSGINCSSLSCLDRIFDPGQTSIFFIVKVWLPLWHRPLDCHCLRYSPDF